MSATWATRPSPHPPVPARHAPPPAGALNWAQRGWAGLRQAGENWPGLCCLCGRWQARTLCRDCEHAWRPPASLKRCHRCALPWLSATDAEHCPVCERQSPEFDRAITALDYVAPWSHLIGRLKFQHDTALVTPLARLLTEAVRQRPHPVDLVLPVPLSPSRLRERGFNQAWLLGRQVAHALGHRGCDQLVLRTRSTHRLMGLSAADRQASISGVFSLAPGARAHLRGRHVAVVDDVLTTGATLNEVTQVLREAGAASVSAWVLARTPDPGGLS